MTGKLTTATVDVLVGEASSTRRMWPTRTSSGAAPIGPRRRHGAEDRVAGRRPRSGIAAEEGRHCPTWASLIAVAPPLGQRDAGLQVVPCVPRNRPHAAIVFVGERDRPAAASRPPFCPQLPRHGLEILVHAADAAPSRACAGPEGSRIGRPGGRSGRPPDPSASPTLQCCPKTLGLIPRKLTTAHESTYLSPAAGQ